MPKMRRKSDLPTKPCRHCGREMTWRRIWSKTWNEVAYCSERCRGEAAGQRASAHLEVDSSDTGIGVPR